MTTVLALLLLAFQGPVVHVSTVAELRAAVTRATPGTTILLAPGEYAGGIHFQNVHGAEGRPIVIAGADPSSRPRIVGGGSGLQFSKVSHLEIRDLVLTGATGNGLNVDDGGDYGVPSRHVAMRNLHVSDLPSGNNDGIKLSGVEHFVVEGCTVERWGGSAVDMVGCRQGLITDSTFHDGGDSGVQCKGGTSEVTVRRTRFERYGHRGVNIGGSTDLRFFRPPVQAMAPRAKYEAKNIVVEGCTFVGGVAPVAFVGVDGATVRYNTIYHPERWALRILQETTADGFVPSRNGVFERNLVVFRSDRWFTGGVNVGPGTAPATFRFIENFWYCSDRAEQSRPRLPTEERDGVTGKDPMLASPERGDFAVGIGSPAAAYGAGAF
jgi:hypothetical protein